MTPPIISVMPKVEFPSLFYYPHEPHVGYDFHYNLLPVVESSKGYTIFTTDVFGLFSSIMLSKKPDDLSLLKSSHLHF
jgi:hypothetical protein